MAKKRNRERERKYREKIGKLTKTKSPKLKQVCNERKSKDRKIERERERDRERERQRERERETESEHCARNVHKFRSESLKTGWR